MLALPLIAAVYTAIVSQAAPAAPAFERAVLAEINRARADPASVVPALRDSLANYRGTILVPRRSGVAYVTEEGVVPVQEAIAFMTGETAQATLAPAAVLAEAAADHQAEQGAGGGVGHVGRDGSTPAERVRRRGGKRYVGEVIAYGSTDPADIVRQFIVDDGVADRSHRLLLFDPSLRYAGVACGGHPVYRFMCVVTLGRTADGRPLHGGTTRRL